LVETWEILTIENDFFCSWAVLTIPYFWRFSSYYHSFDDGKFSWVDKKHPYEMDEKNHKKGLWMRKKLMIKKWSVVTF